MKKVRNKIDIGRAFKKIQEDLQQKPKSLVIDVETRFLSCYHMIVSVLDRLDAIRCLLNEGLGKAFFQLFFIFFIFVFIYLLLIIFIYVFIHSCLY